MTKPYSAKELEIKDEIQGVRHLFDHNGLSQVGTTVTISDALATPDAPIAFKRVITELVQETIEPMLVGERLFDKISYSGYGNSITLRTFGAPSAQDLSMAEGQEYPEFSLADGKGSITASIGKSGLAVAITEEMIKYSQWDIIGMHVRKAAAMLARDKERKIFDVINNNGVVIFDNETPASAEIGRTSGRDVTGAGNGSLTMDDFFDMYAKTMERGFSPNIMLVHPLAWATFVKDPVMRDMILHGNAGLNNWYTSMPQNVYPNTPSAWHQIGKLSGPSVKNPTKEEREGTQRSVIALPPTSPLGSMIILPSPHVPFDPVKKTTSFIMLDSSNVGALIVAEEPQMDEWKDPARDIYKIKLRERYGLALYNDGMGVSVARNISIEPNEISLPPQATVTNIAKIDRK